MKNERKKGNDTFWINRLTSYSPGRLKKKDFEWKHFFLPELMPVRRDCREIQNSLFSSPAAEVSLEDSNTHSAGYCLDVWVQRRKVSWNAGTTHHCQLEDLLVIYYAICAGWSHWWRKFVCEVEVNLTPGYRRWHKSSVCTDRLPVRWFGAESQDMKTGRIWTQTCYRQPNNH